MDVWGLLKGELPYVYAFKTPVPRCQSYFFLFYYFLYFSTETERKMVYCNSAWSQVKTELVQNAIGPGQRASGTVLLVMKAVKSQVISASRWWGSRSPEICTDSSTLSNNLFPSPGLQHPLRLLLQPLWVGKQDYLDPCLVFLLWLLSLCFCFFLHFALMVQTFREDGAKAESNITFSLREVYFFLASTYFHIFNKQHERVSVF